VRRDDQAAGLPVLPEDAGRHRGDPPLPGQVFEPCQERSRDAVPLQVVDDEQRDVRLARVSRARRIPSDRHDLLALRGAGAGFVKRYAKPVLQLIQSFESA